MFRNSYDGDATIFSPQGRLHQVDYAVEAMKQGSATVAIKSDTHAVVVALKRAQNDLCSHQKKIFEVDTHLGVSIAGLLSDGRILSRYLQTECSSWRWDYKVPIPMATLVDNLQLKLQTNTQYYGRRPFGVGLLLIGYDKDGPHVVQTDPSAHVAQMKAASIGARSQSARTYLERHLESFASSQLDDLIRHALMALRDTMPAEENLSKEITSVGVVGKNTPLTLIEGNDVQKYLDRIAGVPRTTAQPVPRPAAAVRSASRSASGPAGGAPP